MRAGVGANIPVTVSSSVTPGGASAAYTLLILITLVIATTGALALLKMGGAPSLPSFSWGRKKQAHAPPAPAAMVNPINGVTGNPIAAFGGAKAPEERGSSF